MCAFIAQLVKHRTGITKVTGSNPLEALIFFQASSFQLLQLEIYCDDHSSLSEREELPGMEGHGGAHLRVALV